MGRTPGLLGSLRQLHGLPPGRRLRAQPGCGGGAAGALEALSAEQRRGFPPLCPDLVVELVSPSDTGPRGAESLRCKLAAYLANGAQLGWLLFPEQQAVEIWQPEAEPQRVEAAQMLEGGDLLAGLRLELGEIWAG